MKPKIKAKAKSSVTPKPPNPPTFTAAQPKYKTGDKIKYVGTYTPRIGLKGVVVSQGYQTKSKSGDIFFLCRVKWNNGETSMIGEPVIDYDTDTVPVQVPPTKVVLSRMTSCPLCGKQGEIIFNKVVCGNKGCRNERL
jgi:hypothetical protein